MNSADHPPSDDWRPTAAWPALVLRAELLARTRQFFATRGFLEVETPQLSADVVVDRHLDPLGVTLPAEPRAPDVGRKLWLQTSPEFGMKRLLAAEAKAIYQITRAFRADEIGPLHNPEFTIVEWYQPGDTLAAGIGRLSDLAETLLGLGPAETISYAQAFERVLNVNPHLATMAELSASARARGLSVSESFADADKDAWLNLLLTECIEPGLGLDRPVVLYDYPASQAALAQVQGDPPVAKRFELYLRGIELANGYLELLDDSILRTRNRQANSDRTHDGKPSLPEDSRLLAAMRAGLPPCVGVALGFDRVVMLAAGAKSLAEVLAFPIDRA